MNVVSLGLTFRVIWAIAPYAMFSFSFLGALTIGLDLTEDRPEVPTLLAIDQIETGQSESSWVDLRDGQLFLREGGAVVTQQGKNEVKSDNYIPYCSEARMKDWSRQGGMQGSLVLVKLSEAAMSQLKDRGQPVDETRESVPFQCLGVMADAAFNIPAEVSSNYANLGFTKIYIVEPGTEPTTRDVLIFNTVLLAVLAVCGLFWLRARRRTRSNLRAELG